MGGFDDGEEMVKKRIAAILRVISLNRVVPQECSVGELIH